MDKKMIRLSKALILLFGIVSSGHSIQDISFFRFNNSHYQNLKYTSNPTNGLSFGRQFGNGIVYGMGVGVGLGFVVGVATIPTCDGWGCIGAIGITIIASEVGYLTGTSIGVIKGSDGRLTTGGKVLSVIGSAVGFASSIALGASTENYKIFLISNFLLPPIFSAFFSRGGVINENTAVLYNSTSNTFKFPSINYSLNFSPEPGISSNLFSFNINLISF